MVSSDAQVYSRLCHIDLGKYAKVVQHNMITHCSHCIK
jgi:hypothetical protein